MKATFHKNGDLSLDGKTPIGAYAKTKGGWVFTPTRPGGEEIFADTRAELGQMIAALYGMKTRVTPLPAGEAIVETNAQAVALEVVGVEEAAQRLAATEDATPPILAPLEFVLPSDAVRADLAADTGRYRSELHGDGGTTVYRNDEIIHVDGPQHDYEPTAAERIALAARRMGKSLASYRLPIVSTYRAALGNRVRTKPRKAPGTGPVTKKVPFGRTIERAGKIVRFT